MRFKIFKYFTLPIFVAGIFWWHVRNSFETGYAWEKKEMEK